ncbi:salicylate hydroxylase [Moniliophthora roreri MCA 2997]|uniref:Salicylate hydroxylase n=2 Tax=Moniliophthora roreri TaxID=221103 RepID=V2YU10_MONRO|nr:salicylate hydroxylase [Moniliophthora roreri MCA 2997]
MDGIQAEHPLLHVVIIGSGMGGLTCALALAKAGFKHIDVYETASDLGFVGAGIQLAPNMARVLDNLGVWEDIAAEAVELKTTSIRQGSTNEELAQINFDYIRETYAYPHMVGHRASLAGALFKACNQQSAITFHFATAVDEVLSWGPKPKMKLIPRDGEPYESEVDLVLGCDGVKSKIRSQMMRALGVTADVEDSGQAAYRIMLKREELEHDPELLDLIENEAVTRWIGEKRHIIAYPVSNRTIYNISTAQPDIHFAEAPSITYTTKGSKKQMLEVYQDFCPMVQRLLNLVPEGEVCEWKLRVHSPLPTWVHKQIALVGDACHPTLPHMAQGAAQAIEDAAVLAIVLAKMIDNSPETLNKTLRVYELLRKDRAQTLVDLATASAKALHLGEGKAREERDKVFAALKEKNGKGPVPDKWADADMQRMIYGHDCVQHAKREYDVLFNTLN